MVLKNHEDGYEAKFIQEIVDGGIIKINEAICCKKVLVVIEDVDEVENIDAILETREFYPGSKIIITTRNSSLLKVHQVHKLYTVERQYFDESLELFSQHAFGKEHPEMIISHSPKGSHIIVKVFLWLL